jgi:serine/threonine protein phosphatase 1
VTSSIAPGIFSPDEARRLVIVGDVHGCFAERLELLEKVQLQPEDLLISVGDLVDRGPESPEVVRFFRDRPGTIVLMGNHERKHARAVFSYAQEITRLQFGERYGEAVAWMSALPYFYEDARVRVVHAALVPGIPLAEQRLEILAGTTSGERELALAIPEGPWHAHYRDDKPVVFGHHVVGREPMVRDGKVFGLDTGACHGWTLTALSVPDFTLTSVPARADHWAAAKPKWQLPVLQSKPWLPLSWAELAEQFERFADSKSDAARAWLAELRAWVEALRAHTGALHAAAHAVTAQLLATHGAEGFAAAARQHPAAPLLFQVRRARLDEASLAKLCTSPQRLRDFAAQLEVSVPAPPAPLS